MKTVYLFFTALGMSLGVFAQNTATYTITFNSNWSNSSHPHPQGMFPENAHWSRLVGATHNEQGVFLEMGGLASAGVEDIAELGVNSAFENEVDTAIDQGWANQYIFGDPLSTGLGQIIIEGLEVDEDFPYLTLLSMIAPSPDWMIAINSVPLLDEEGQWRELIEIDLYPYDAGTDSGTDYNSLNNNTNPQQPISNIQGVSPFSDEIVGTLSIQLETVLGVNDSNLSVDMSPNPFQHQMILQTQESLKKVSVYNSIGVLVAERSLNNNTKVRLQTDAWTTGLYLVSVEFASGQSRVLKAIKN